MSPFDVENALKSMIILTDTRERETAQAERRYESFGVPYERKCLNYGDYTFATSSMELYDGSDISPQVVIERKMNLAELSQCFCQSRKRFQAEMERAKEHGAKIYLLVENASWESLYNGKYRTKYNPAAFVGSLTAWMARYDITPIFCKAETSGKIIKDILYREFKERLERGDFDAVRR